MAGLQLGISDASRGSGIGSGEARIRASAMLSCSDRSMALSSHDLGDLLAPSPASRIVRATQVDRTARPAALIDPLVEAQGRQPRELEDRQEGGDEDRPAGRAALAGEQALGELERGP